MREEARKKFVGSGPATSDESRGWCLCLSGGGFRATLFHLGGIERLNELGVLSRLSTITSVSGGSILNGVMASRWSRLQLGSDGIYTNLEEEISRPVRTFCTKDLRTPLLVGTRLDPRNWPSLLRDGFSVSGNFLADGYERLFRCRLGDVTGPGGSTPRFVFCATNVRTGACWHFHTGSQARMGDFYEGYYDADGIRVSDAVAASSAYPLGFSAYRLRLPKECRPSRCDPWGEERVVSAKRGRGQHRSGQVVLLTDGGVYDNLAVEPVWNKYRTLLISDAGRPFESARAIGQMVITRLKRASDISMEQVAAVRKRWIVADFLTKRRTGALWTLNTRLEDFGLCDARGYENTARPLLHSVRTDLDAFSQGEIACLENHGYSLADAALRARAPALCRDLAASFHWPHQAWSEDSAAIACLQGSNQRKIGRDIMRFLARDW